MNLLKFGDLRYFYSVVCGISVRLIVAISFGDCYVTHQKVACPPICNGIPLQHDSTKGSCCKMTNNELTFNDLPQVVAELRDEVSGINWQIISGGDQLTYIHSSFHPR